MENTLSTPSIYAITAFDPSQPHTFYFQYDDNQAVKNRAIIRDISKYDEEDEIVYDKEQIGMKLSHTIPANSESEPENRLEPGKQYAISIQVFDNYGKSSDFSEEALFYCYSAPQFAFIDFPQTTYVNPNITLSLNYSQAENETLKSYQFLMYSYDKTLLSSSEILYDTTNMTYQFSSLNNNEIYFFRAIGETTHGMSVDTGFCELAVQYQVSPANILLNLNNHKSLGYISIACNIVDIAYEVENDNYTFQDGCVTLKDNSVLYKEFHVDGDFTLILEAKELPLGVFFKSNDLNLTLRLIRSCGTYYCEFKSDNYVIYKNLPKAKLSTRNNKIITNTLGQKIEIVNTSYDSNDLAVFEVKRKNNVYSLNTYYKADYLTEKMEG